MLPNLLSAPHRKVIRFDLQRNVALFSKDIEIPLQPFMGIMAVAPSMESWMISSRPPQRQGGREEIIQDSIDGATAMMPMNGCSGISMSLENSATLRCRSNPSLPLLCAIETKDGRLFRQTRLPHALENVIERSLRSYPHVRPCSQ
ncbi:MAG TPA: hypothetical protein VG095_09845 [Chthoniobacterales bacterium]|nr:hypothetical protein [Chthoniobacterales bacterium]